MSDTKLPVPEKKKKTKKLKLAEITSQSESRDNSKLVHYKGSKIQHPRSVKTVDSRTVHERGQVPRLDFIVRQSNIKYEKNFFQGFRDSIRDMGSGE
jgi:hypothetical protein